MDKDEIIGSGKEVKLFFRTKVLYYDAEKTELLGKAIQENGEINICFADIDAVMPEDKENQVTVFIKGIHLTVEGDYKKVEANWQAVKKLQHQIK